MKSNIWNFEAGQEPAYVTVGCREGMGMEGLRRLFPEGRANEENVVLFSTSGVHGSYKTLEDMEREVIGQREGDGAVTFVVVHPRTCCLRYGVCEPQNGDDIAFLKGLRESSREAMVRIG